MSGLFLSRSCRPSRLKRPARGGEHRRAALSHVPLTFSRTPTLFIAAQNAKCSTLKWIACVCVRRPKDDVKSTADFGEVRVFSYRRRFTASFSPSSSARRLKHGYRCLEPQPRTLTHPTTSWRRQSLSPTRLLLPFPLRLTFRRTTRGPPRRWSHRRKRRRSGCKS